MTSTVPSERHSRRTSTRLRCARSRRCRTAPPGSGTLSNSQTWSWEQGEISIAHEHCTTAITHLSLSLLHPRLLLNRLLLGRSLVATSVGSKAHELGIRMIADLLEQAGWRTSYLEADVPHEDVIATVAQQRADVPAVSATMAGHIREVRELCQGTGERIHAG
jgi:methanogenic corrinoid protein MtbC1